MLKLTPEFWIHPHLT